MNEHMTWSARTLELFAAAKEAMRQVPPAFPLEATVAVNPWLGQTGEDRSVAAARMARVGAGRMFLPREAVAALIDAGEVATEDLFAAAAAHGLDPGVLARAASDHVKATRMRSMPSARPAGAISAPSSAGAMTASTGPPSSRNGSVTGPPRSSTGDRRSGPRPRRGPGPLGAPMPAAT